MGKNANKRKRRNSALLVEDAQRPLKDYLPIVQRIESSFAGVLTGIVVLLYVYRARQVGALWRDEVATLGVSTMPSFSQLWSSLPHECCAVFPYLGLRTWTGVSWLGGGDTSLRILAASIGIGILLAFWFLRKGLGHTVPIFSLILFGLNPTVMRWVISIRGYSLGILFILLALGLIWEVTKLPSRGRVALAALVSVMSVQCLYQNAIFLFAICLGASLVCIRKRRWKTMLLILGIGGVSALSLLPYLPIMKEARDVLVIIQEPYSWSFIVQRLRVAFSMNYLYLWWAWIACVALCIITASYFIVFKRNDPAHEAAVDLCIFNLVLVFMSTVLLIVFLKSTGLHANTWHYIILMGMIAVSVDIGLKQAANSFRKRVGRLAFALAIAVVTLPVTWQVVSERFTNVDLIASAMEERASNEDLIVLNPYWLGITFQHYYRGKTKWVTIPPVEDLRINRFDLIKEKMSTENPLQPIWNDIEETLRSGNRVWLVGDVYSPPAGELPQVPPPAPNGPQGWRFEPYFDSWGIQLGYFLNSHAGGGQVVPLEGTDDLGFIPGLETPNVRVGEGWHE